MTRNLFGFVSLLWIQQVCQGIEIPIRGGCRRSVQIEGLYDIVFVSQDAGKYKPDTECIISIEAPRNHGIHLVFTHMDLQPVNAEGICSDYVQIQELQGKDLKPKLLTDKLCGGKIPDPIDTQYSHLEILFYSDAFVEKSGFKFYFTRTDSPANDGNEVNGALNVHTNGFFSSLLFLVLVLNA